MRDADFYLLFLLIDTVSESGCLPFSCPSKVMNVPEIGYG